MNNKPRLALLGVLAIVVLGAGGYWAYDSYESERAAEAATAAVRTRDLQRKQQAEAQREAQAQILRSLKDPGPSRWLQQGLAPLWSALTKSNVRVLIIPPSNPDEKLGLDVTARVALARALADSLAAQDAVPDPGLAFAALGEPRTLDESALLKRLRDSHVESLVTGSLEVESGRITLDLHRTDLPTLQRRSYQAKVDMGAADRPEQSLEAIAVPAIQALGFEAKPREKEIIKVLPALALPSSPLAATSDRSDPLTGLWLQQLLAVFHSPLFLADPRAQERMFERTLWSLSAVSADSADRAVLEARALSYLGRREAALRALEGAPSSPESVALRAYLNADLPALKKAVADIRRPVARLIGELELIPVRAAAGDVTRESRRAEAQRVIKEVPEAWQALVALYALAFDPWDFPAPVVVKGVLERDFPVPDYRAQDIVQAKVALGGRPYDPKVQAELTLSPLIHVRKWREQHIGELCCVRPAARAHRPALTDYLDLLENSAEALVLGHLYFLRVVQGNRDDALATIKLYDELQFAGSHPGVLMEKGSAFVRTVRQPSSAWNNDEVFEASRKIKAWTGYQSKAAAWAAQEWQRSVSQVASARGYRGAYTELLRSADKQPLAGDFPGRDVFLNDVARAINEPGSSRQREKDVLRKACILAVYYFGPCHGYASLVRSDGQDEERKQVDELLRGRFNGYANAASVKVDYLRDLGRIAEAKTLLREALKTSPAEELYSEFGAVLSGEGEFDEAVKVYAALPGLKSAGENTVGLSNYLHGAAQHLLVRGAAPQAKRLIEIGASYHDGSQANLEARVQVAFWANDGELALQQLRAIYQRYPNGKTPAQIAALMFALGDNAGAWSVLRSASPHGPDYASFAAAEVGLRRERAGVQEVLAWAEAVGAKPYVWTAEAAFHLFAIDRNPEVLQRFVEAEPTLRAKDANNYSHGIVFGRMLDTTAEDNAAALRATVDGYRELLRGNYPAAVNALMPLLEQFDKTGIPQGFEGPGNLWAMVPYMAYAFARSGRHEQAVKLLERFEERRQRAAGRDKIMVKIAPAFETHLVNAIVAASAGNHALGLKELRLAQGQLTDYGRTRLIAQHYELAELAEWLGRDTGNSAYVFFAVDFARAYEVYEPWAAWGYAFEAAHAKDQASRVRAAGIAMWLDPDSRRLLSLSPTLRSSAKQWLQRNPPFRKPAAGKREAKV